MLPFRLRALPVVRVWGGTRLAALLGHADTGEPLGESWEVHGSLPILDGPQAGLSLDQLTQSHGAELLGQWRRPGTTFPLLTKWLDCHDWLSVQVHPDDAVAARLEGPDERGKTEAWFFWQVQPQARYLHGWKNGGPRGAALQALQGRAWVEQAAEHHPNPGDWAYTPAGTVHALGPGLLVFEVQQSSDLTYRLYDWERVGLDGQPRETHREKGLAAIAESQAPEVSTPPPGLLGEIKVLSPYFCVEEVRGERRWSPAGQSVELLTALSDGAVLECESQSLPVPLAHSVVIPAAAPELRWLSPPDSRWIRVRLMPPQG